MSTVLDRLASPLDVGTFLSTFNPLWGSKLQGVIEDVRPLTEDSAAIRIRPGRAWKGHVAGQFVTVGVDIAGVRHHRCFSLTSPPGRRGDVIEIAVHCGPDGFVSRHLVHDARPGEVVQLTQAEGDFTLPLTSAPKLLFIAGGSGITPVMGMLRTISRSGGDADAVVLHHARTVDQMMFRSELSQLSAEDWLTFSATFTAEGGAHLDADRLARECPDWADRQVYVCGPGELLGFVESHWASVDLTHHVHVERFVQTGWLRTPPAREVDPTGAVTDKDIATGTTSFGRSKLQVASEPGRPLLEVAEDAGLAPAYGCRMGICHTCTTRLDEGCVTDLRDGRISEAGSHIRICVSAAAEDVTLDL